MNGYKINKETYQRRRKAKIIYYIKQKLFGFSMALFGIVIPFVIKVDIALSILIVPLGIYLMFTKKRAITV